VTSIRTAAAHKRRTGVVLYWRPIVPGWNDAPDTMGHVLDTGRDVDAIVFTGYYHKPENAGYLRGLGVEVPFGADYHRRKTMPADLDATVVAAWRTSGIATPLFRKTSCGVAYAHGVADTTATGACGNCATSAPLPSSMWGPTASVSSAATPLQHTLRYQIWELDQPHYLHAHGRSRTGHATDSGQVEAFSAVRASFTNAARGQPPTPWPLSRCPANRGGSGWSSWDMPGAPAGPATSAMSQSRTTLLLPRGTRVVPLRRKEGSAVDRNHPRRP
jgi:hypothetical protein